MAGDFDRVNRRMHNKAFIADNQRAIVGGRNIADEYFEASGVSNYTDLDVGLAGPVVAQVSAVFDAFWNAPTAYPILAVTGQGGATGDLDGLRQALTQFVASQHESPYVQRARTRSEEILLGANDVRYYAGIAHLVFDDPAKVTRDRSSKEGRLLPQFSTLGVPLDHELTIVSPYFVPGDEGVALLAAMVDRGVRVTVLTNSLAASDVTIVHAAYKRYRESLVSHGVRLYELRPDAFEVVAGPGGRQVNGEKAALHAKVFYFDRQAVFIGSLNLDPRSIQLNTEMGVVCRNAEMTEALLGNLESHLDRIAWRVEQDTDDAGRARLVWVETGDAGVRKHIQEPGNSGWRKFKVWFLGLLPVESQL
jgi:putative cardiolipin synthase